MAVHSVSSLSLLVSVCTVKPSMWIYFHILLLIWISYNTPVTGQQVIGSSQTVLAKVDDDVILCCHIEPPVDMERKTVEWSRPDLKPGFVHVLQDGRFRHSNPLYKQRTFLFNEELSHGNISLKLSRVKLSDEGTYKCFAPTLKSSSLIQLRVGAVSQPMISLIGSKDDVLSWTCDSGCWFPQPEMFWLDSDGNNITAEPSVTERRSQHCYVVQRNVTVTRGGHVTCRVQLPHINDTVEIQPVIPERVSQEEQSGSAKGTTAWILMTISMILVAAILGYFYWKKKQTGKQEDINNKAAHFVMQHRAELTLKVSRVSVKEILNSLGTMVPFELYTEINEEKTSMDQMMRLYREILEPEGAEVKAAEVKAAFYKALQQQEPKLFDSLDNHVMTEKPLILQPTDLWSQWNCPVLCGGRGTEDTKDRAIELDAVEHLTDKATFVLKNKAQLIQHVYRVMAIVASLRPVIDPKLCTKIEAEKTRQKQMRTLYQMYMPDDRNKARFYDALKLHEPHLLKWLEHRTTKDAVDLTPEDKARFVEENRGHLITNVSRVMAILDTLESMIHSEIYDEIQKEETSMDQMWILYRKILQQGGTKVRAAFYNALKDHQPHLLKILDEEVNDVSIDVPDTQDLETAPLLNPSNQTVGPSETASLLNPSNQTVGPSEPSHFGNQLDRNRRVKMVTSVLDLLFTEKVTMEKMTKLYENLHSKIAEDMFYKVLEEHKKFLLDNLKNPPCWTALKELDDEKFQVFKLYLRKADNLEGLQPLPESLLENADRMDTADLIMQTYHSEGDQIMKKVLEDIKQLPDQSTPEASAGHFVNQYRDDLVKRVKMIDPILDLLVDEGVITSDDYGNVRSKPTTMETMEELYKLLESRRAKDIFYRGLREHEKFLLDDLKNPPFWTDIIHTLEELGNEDFNNFQWHLQQLDNLEGLQPLPESLLEKTDRMDIANLIVKTYASNATQIVINVLRKIDKNDLVERFLPKGPEGDNSQPVIDSEKEKDQQKDNNPVLGGDSENEKGATLKKLKGTEGDNSQPMSDSEKEKGPKLKKLKGALLTINIIAGTFVDKERDSLIKRVTQVKPILDHLCKEGVIDQEDHSTVMCKEPKTVEQMISLYEILKTNGPKAKTSFYKALKVYEKDLLDKL